MPKKYDEAVRRQQAFAALTPREKLAKLENAGHGHCREAQKYRAMLTAQDSDDVMGAEDRHKKTRKMRKSDRKKARR